MALLNNPRAAISFLNKAHRQKPATIDEGFWLPVPAAPSIPSFPGTGSGSYDCDAGCSKLKTAFTGMVTTFLAGFDCDPMDFGCITAAQTAYLDAIDALLSAQDEYCSHGCNTSECGHCDSDLIVW